MKSFLLTTALATAGSAPPVVPATVLSASALIAHGQAAIPSPLPSPTFGVIPAVSPAPAADAVRTVLLPRLIAATADVQSLATFAAPSSRRSVAGDRNAGAKMFDNGLPATVNVVDLVSPAYSGRPGGLTSGLLLSLNSRLSDFVKREPGQPLAAFDLGGGFSSFADAMIHTVEHTEELRASPAIRQAARQLTARIQELKTADMPYLQTLEAAAMISNLIGLAQAHRAKIAAPQESRGNVFRAVARSARATSAKAESLYEKYTAIMLPTLGHFGYQDPVRAWNSGIFQFGIFARDAPRFGNDVNAPKFLEHDLEHMDEFLLNFIDHLDARSKPVPPTQRLNRYKKNIQRAARLSTSIEALPRPVRAVAYRVLYQVSHESNTQLHGLAQFADHYQYSPQELDFYLNIARAEKNRLSSAQVREFAKWWKSIPAVLKP